MRNILAIFVLIITLFPNCKKDKPVTSIGYDVNGVNFTSVTIMYTNAIGQNVTETVSNAAAREVKISNKPFTATLKAVATNPDPTKTITLNLSIVVNGTIAKSGSNQANGSVTAELQHVIQ